MTQETKISQNSRRIARNTAFLYVRMLVLLAIGLFTSRIVLEALGVRDFGVYNAVGGIIALFSMVTASISAAISRFLAFEIGGGKNAQRVFSTALLLQIVFSALLLVLGETLGLWFLKTHMNIPPESEIAALWVYQCSIGVMIIQLMSMPFNALIIAHERMNAYAYISILEAALKLAVALILAYIAHHLPQTLSLDPLTQGPSPLIYYAVMMLAVQAIVRGTYSIYCRRKFTECRTHAAFHKDTFREMLSFTGWNFYGSAMAVANTQGVTILLNIFFGVLVNAARGVAIQVEGMIKQFVTNFLTALNPQITKSYASGDLTYCHELVRKGSKFSTLILLLFIVPITFEADTLLGLWLKEVPENAATFVRLSLWAILADMSCNSLLTLIQASGQIRNYYIVSGSISALIFIGSWIAFRLGAPAWTTYLIFICVYALTDVVKLFYAHKTTGLKIWPFVKEALAKPLAIGIVALAVCDLPFFFITNVFVRFFFVVSISTTIICVGAFRYCLTLRERVYIIRKIVYKAGRYLPDGLYLRGLYFIHLGKKLNLKDPQTFNEKLQWLKLHDHNPLYTTLCDKLAVKEYVSERIGAEHVIPTLGAWSRAEDIEWDKLPEKFVLKCNHDSGSVVICTDHATFDRKQATEKLSKALKQNFYKVSREWPYKNIRPCIIAEPYLGELADYKFFCFDGHVKFLFVATDRFSGEETKFDFFDTDFNHMNVLSGHPNADVTPSKPANFSEMTSLAEKLSDGLKHVRVDLYEKDGKLYFGELTFYHWSGLVPFEPAEFDKTFGDYLTL